jgi:hypothetical protein
MHYGVDDNIRPVFNDIRIDLRGNGVNNNQYSNENDQRSQGSVPSRISRYSGKIKYKYKINKIFFLKNILKFDRQIHYMQVNQQ